MAPSCCFAVIVFFYGLLFLRHRPLVSENFSGYVFGPDLPSAAFLYVIPVSVVILSPLIYKLAPELWVTIGVWWLALELCWLLGHRLPTLVPEVWPRNRSIPSV